MEDRKQRILRAITDEYTQTAEPVGSRTVARKYLPGVSPATIRNEMADLEEQGYLEQPHASAGRIPSDLGYRYYVDELMEVPAVDPEEVRMVRDLLMARRDADHAVRAAGRTLSQSTRYSSIVLRPSLGRLSVRRMDLTPLDDSHVLLLVVADPAFVYNRILDWPPPLPSPADLAQISAALTEAVLQSDQELSRTLAQQVRDLLPGKEARDQTLQALSELMEDRGSERAYLDGVGFFLEQPEFRDVTYARRILEYLSDPDILVEVMRQGHVDDLLVVIGREQSVPALSDCSVVMAPYGPEGRVIGVIGLIGPTRMDYPRAVSAVERVAGALSEALGRLTRWPRGA